MLNHTWVNVSHEKIHPRIHCCSQYAHFSLISQKHAKQPLQSHMSSSSSTKSQIQKCIHIDTALPSQFQSLQSLHTNDVVSRLPFSQSSFNFSHLANFRYKNIYMYCKSKESDFEYVSSIRTNPSLLLALRETVRNVLKSTMHVYDQELCSSTQSGSKHDSPPHFQLECCHIH